MSEPVTITLNATAAQLLVKIAGQMNEAGENNDLSAVVMRALGLLEMAQRTRRQGGKLFFRNEQGLEAEVAF